MTLICLGQSYIILQLNILYKSKNLTEYVTMTTPKKKETPKKIPDEVEVEIYP